MNNMLHGRIENWKFDSALKYLDGEPEYTVALIQALARVFGDCGWFDGDMGLIVCAACDRLAILNKPNSV